MADYRWPLTSWFFTLVAAECDGRNDGIDIR
jgi:hypothetical protein